MAQEYIFATTVESALALLKERKGAARIIAGGTDLVLQESRRKEKSTVLVDLSHIPDLHGIKECGGDIVIGACVTHAEASVSPLLRAKAPALAAACGKVGGRQIRNMGTLVGNVVSGQPAGDAAVALTALDALCTVHTCDGKVREVSMARMYAGVCESSVDCCAEIVTHIRIPAHKAGEASSYQRMEQRKALSLPMLCVAAKLGLEGGTITAASIAMAPVGPGPQRAAEAEAFLIGKKAEKAVFVEAAALADKNAAFRSSSVRGSKEFRHAVLPVFIVRALEEAAARAGAR